MSHERSRSRRGGTAVQDKTKPFSPDDHKTRDSADKKARVTSIPAGLPLEFYRSVLADLPSRVPLSMDGKTVGEFVPDWASMIGALVAGYAESRLAQRWLDLGYKQEQIQPVIASLLVAQLRSVRGNISVVLSEALSILDWQTLMDAIDHLRTNQGHKQLPKSKMLRILSQGVEHSYRQRNPGIKVGRSKNSREGYVEEMRRVAKEWPAGSKPNLKDFAWRVPSLRDKKQPASTLRKRWIACQKAELLPLASWEDTFSLLKTQR